MKGRTLQWMAAVLVCVAFAGACSNSDSKDDATTTTGEATTTTGVLTTEELCTEINDTVIEGVGGPDGFPTEAAELEQLLTKLENLQDQVPAELKTPLAIILLATQEFAAGTVPDLTTPTSTPSTSEFEKAGEDVQKWYDDNCEDGSGGSSGGKTTSTTRGGGATTTTSSTTSTTSSTTSTTFTPSLPDPPTAPTSPVDPVD